MIVTKGTGFTACSTVDSADGAVEGDAGLQRVCNPCVTAMQEAADLKAGVSRSPAKGWEWLCAEERVFALADALDSITGEGDPGKEEDDSGEAKKSLQQGFLACEVRPVCISMHARHAYETHEASVSKLEDLRRRHEVAFTQE